MFTSPWMSRSAALLLLAAAISAAYLWMIDPLIAAYRQMDEAVLQARDMNARFAELAASRKAMMDAAEELNRRPASSLNYLVGETDALAAATLQERVKSLIENDGAAISSIQPLAGAEEHGLRRITVRSQWTTTIAPLLRTLYELETGTPPLFVDNVSIAARASGPPDQEPILTVALDVYGFMAPVASTDVRRTP